jgi:methionine biosynthesis protein MetW
LGKVKTHQGSQEILKLNFKKSKRRFGMNNTSLYNQKYYEEQEFGFSAEERSDHKHILELLKPKANDKVLEIGCGFGVLLKKIPSRKKMGIETNDTAIRKCRKLGLSITKANAEKGLSFNDSSFDIVIMNEVIEHLKKPEFVLEECSRILVPGGKIIITTPIRSFFAHDLSSTHFSEMNIQELRKLIKKSGFKILSHKVSGISFLYPLLENFLFKPFRFFRFFLKKKKNKNVDLIDSFHGVVDKTFLKPLNYYRKYFLNLGLDQLLFAQKKEDEISLYDQKYYKKHKFVFSAEERSDHKRILELLKPKSSDKVLEIGCGFGILLKKIPSKKKIGIELNDFAIKECLKRGINVIKANVEKGLPFRDSSFDIIIMNEVISHLRNPMFVLKECFRILTPKGKIIMTAPVRSIFFHNISETHLSEMTIRELKELVQQCGFKVLSHEVCGISFLYPLMENFLFKPFRFLKYILGRRQEKTVKLIDSCRGLVDKTFLKPLSLYRKCFLILGLNQLIIAQK